jgi:hypothetical protein
MIRHSFQTMLGSKVSCNDVRRVGSHSRRTRASGLTFVGEWGFPISCTDARWMRKVYGWNRHIWLYPTKGLGYWFNAGKTAAAYNKVVCGVRATVRARARVCVSASA